MVLTFIPPWILTKSSDFNMSNRKVERQEVHLTQILNFSRDMGTFDIKFYAIPFMHQKPKRAASKVEVGTKTVDTSMDEWLQVCFCYGNSYMPGENLKTTSDIFYNLISSYP